MSIKQNLPNPLFLTDNIKIDRIPTKLKWKTCPFYIVFQVLKVLLIKLCKIQPPNLLFLVVFISFYISRYHFPEIRYHFLQILELHSTLSEKKISITNFLFKQILHSNPAPTPLLAKICWSDSQQIFFVTLNRFCSFSKYHPPPVLNGQYQDG